MRCDGQNLYVFTGGPGSGKSTLIAALVAEGFATAPEAGRAIIRAQSAIGGPGLPARDPRLFAELMLSWDIRSHEDAAGHSGGAGDGAATPARPVFFDRGIPDIAGYLALCGLPVPDHVRRAAAVFRYHPVVFLAPPWAEIYRRDAERSQSFEEAVATARAVAEAYQACGYKLVELPRADVTARVRFVREHVGV